MEVPGLLSCEYPNCSTTFASDPARQRHVRNVHRSIRDFSCASCKRTFRDNFNLMSHMKVHGVALRNGKQEVSGPKFPCGLCEVVVSSQKALSTHMITHRDDSRLEDSAEPFSRFDQTARREEVSKMLHCYLCEGTIELKYFDTHIKKHADAIQKTSKEFNEILAKFFKTTEEAAAKRDADGF